MQMEAKKTGYRVRGTNEEHIAKKGHIATFEKELLLDNVGNNCLTDKCHARTWEKNYKATPQSNGKDINHGLRCYTNRSKTANGVGWGICIMDGDKVIKTRASGLTGLLSGRNSSNKVSLNFNTTISAKRI